MSWFSAILGRRHDAAGNPMKSQAALVDESAPQITLNITATTTMALVLIPAGHFTMGSSVKEQGRLEDEGPQHDVTISKPFYMGIYPVTLNQYKAVMQQTPKFVRKPSDPLEPALGVSPNDAEKFCHKVTEETGMPSRLPTEAEWEYACRAGSKTRFSFGDDENELGNYAWYGSNSQNMSQPVGSKKPNAWGLYDMHGNVFEWCSDCYSDSYSMAQNVDPRGSTSGSRHVLRGGSWAFGPDYCRSAARFKAEGDYKGTYVGFRLLAELP